MPSPENDALAEANRRIEAARNEHWQKHLREHPYANAKSCPRDYGIHDAYAHAASIVRDVIRQRPGYDFRGRPIPPAGTGGDA